MMHAGTLKRRITLERVTEVQNSFGELVETWNVLAICWAQWLPLKGEEKFAARQFHPELSGEFRLRYRDAHPKDRIKMDGRLFEIEAVIDVEDRHRELRCSVEEQV